MKILDYKGYFINFFISNHTRLYKYKDKKKNIF